MKIQYIVAGALFAVFSASPSDSASLLNNLNQGGSSGYECSSTAFTGDHVPGRSCKCEGGWDSDDCKKMLAEVCTGKAGSVCSTKSGTPISCECIWKKPRTNPNAVLTMPGMNSSGGVMEVAPVEPNQGIILREFIEQNSGKATITIVK